MHADSRAQETSVHRLGQVMFRAIAGITTAFESPSKQIPETNLEAAQ